jgi:flavin prenyltransferase
MAVAPSAPTGRPTQPPSRLVVAITGATGVIYGVRLLEALGGAPGVETHLVLSGPGKRTLIEETDHAVRDVERLAHVVHDVKDIGASIASGSFRTVGMVVAPCSMRTAAAIATGVTGNLVTRAADVTLKEGRPLILLVRETPLHVGHLRTLVALAEIGATVLPPMPAFYHRPKGIDDLVNHTIARVLDRLGLPHDLVVERPDPGPAPP